VATGAIKGTPKRLRVGLVLTGDDTGAATFATVAGADEGGPFSTPPRRSMKDDTAPPVEATSFAEDATAAPGRAAVSAVVADIACMPRAVLGDRTTRKDAHRPPPPQQQPRHSENRG